MLKIQGAVIKQGGDTFALAVVHPRVLLSVSAASKRQRELAECFPGLPVVLMARGKQGSARYFGMADFVEYMTFVDPDSIPLREYRFDEQRRAA